MTPNRKGIHREDYEPNKTYPILVKMGGYHRIVEMLGSHVNQHNRMVREENERSSSNNPYFVLYR